MGGEEPSGGAEPLPGLGGVVPAAGARRPAAVTSEALPAPSLLLCPRQGATWSHAHPERPIYSAAAQAHIRRCRSGRPVASRQRPRPAPSRLRSVLTAIGRAASAEGARGPYPKQGQHQVSRRARDTGRLEPCLGAALPWRCPGPAPASRAQLSRGLLPETTSTQPGSLPLPVTLCIMVCHSLDFNCLIVCLPY